MGLIREHINEKFEQESDPIEDLGIGIINQIKKWCKKMWIDNYVINDDLSIDVFDEVNLKIGDTKPQRGHHPGLYGDKLPDFIQFRNVLGDFYCQASGLKTLKGVPYYVKGSFYCSSNKLTSFKYAPKKIDGDFWCYDNIGYKMTAADEKYLKKHSKIKGRVGISIY